MVLEFKVNHERLQFYMAALSLPSLKAEAFNHCQPLEVSLSLHLTIRKLILVSRMLH